MTIVAWSLFVTAVWIFLASVLRGCARNDAAGARSRDDLFAGELWLWERRGGAIAFRTQARPAGSRDTDRRTVSTTG